jgi:hypothetical protein
MLYVGVSTIEQNVDESTIDQNVGAPTIALAESSQCSKWKNEFIVGPTKLVPRETDCVRTGVLFECAIRSNGHGIRMCAFTKWICA